MATRGPLRPVLLAHVHSLLHIYPPRRQTFLQAILPSDKPVRFHVTRTLPYPRAKLYDIIADVDSYCCFLPFCLHSRVTAWSTDDDASSSSSSSSEEEEEEEEAVPPRKWPTEGDLVVGFGAMVKGYTSRIICVPGKSVVALSGNEEPVAKKNREESPFKKLEVKWTVEDAREGTKVDLDLMIQLQDPLMQFVLGTMVEDSARKMIDAFETRARDLIDDAG